MGQLLSRSGLEVDMFSETGLGSFLREVYSGSYLELLREESTLALSTLLLADESITHDVSTQNELRHVLDRIYGDTGTWRWYENPVSECISSKLAQVIVELNSAGYLKAEAYITGLIGGLDESAIFMKNRLCQRIYSRAFRIFHGQRYALSPQGSNLFIGIIGLKGSGKSSVLSIFEKEGDEVLELYRELDRIKEDCPAKLAALPLRENWEDEPLQLVLQQRGVTAQTQRQIFLGSLLRWSEAELLSCYGRVIFIHLQSTNALRHTRAKIRGREIEKSADQGWLIELDAHRDGLWPTYEQNDLGGLVSLCGYAITNNQDVSPDNLHEQIKEILRKEI